MGSYWKQLFKLLLLVVYGFFVEATSVYQHLYQKGNCCQFGPASVFGAFSKDIFETRITGGISIQGPLASERCVIHDQLSVGHRIQLNSLLLPYSTMMVCKDKLKWTGSGNVGPIGNTEGKISSLDDVGGIQDTELQKQYEHGRVFDFEDAQEWLQWLSITLGEMPSTGEAHKRGGGVLEINLQPAVTVADAKNQKMQIVSFSGSVFEGAPGIDNPVSTFQLNGKDADAILIINVLGSEILLQGMNMAAFANYKETTIWNFVQTNKIFIEATEIFGSVLAPWAKVTASAIDGSIVDGQFFGYSYAGGLQFNMPMFDGCLPCRPEPKCELGEPRVCPQYPTIPQHQLDVCKGIQYCVRSDYTSIFPGRDYPQYVWSPCEITENCMYCGLGPISKHYNIFLHDAFERLMTEGAGIQGQLAASTCKILSSGHSIASARSKIANDACNTNLLASQFAAICQAEFSYAHGVGDIFGTAASESFRFSQQMLDNMLCKPHIIHNSIINFDSVFDQLSTLSIFLSALPRTAPVEISSVGTLIIHCSGRHDFEIIHVSSDMAQKCTRIRLHNCNTLNTTSFVFNMGGRTHPAFPLNISPKLAHKVLWNFYEAVNISTGAINIFGSILAPFAHVSTSPTVINRMDGQMMALSYKGQMQFNWQPFVGCLPCADNQLMSNAFTVKMKSGSVERLANNFSRLKYYVTHDLGSFKTRPLTLSSDSDKGVDDPNTDLDSHNNGLVYFIAGCLSGFAIICITIIVIAVKRKKSIAQPVEDISLDRYETIRASLTQAQPASQI